MKWFEIFRYKDGKLFWNASPRSRARIGDETGNLDSTGHLCVKYKRKAYMVHRIIWEMAEGPIPEGHEIDHVNGLRDDNRVDNLRLATRSQNQWNSCKHKDNTSGLKGVWWHKLKQKWTAQIMAFGKRRFLGYFLTKEEAYQARLEAEKLFHGEFVPSEERKLVMQ